jgi:hypothetical protein
VPVSGIDKVQIEVINGKLLASKHAPFTSAKMIARERRSR